MHRIFVVHWKEAFELILNFSSARWHSWCSNICDLLCFLVSFIDINFGFSYSVSIGPSYLVTSYVLSVPCLSPLTTTTKKKKSFLGNTFSYIFSCTTFCNFIHLLKWQQWLWLHLEKIQMPYADTHRFLLFCPNLSIFPHYSFYPFAPYEHTFFFFSLHVLEKRQKEICRPSIVFMSWHLLY